jgi:Tfp pilus assembly protein PilF
MVFSPEQMAAYNTKAAMYREEGKYNDARDLLHHGLRAARDQMGEDADVTMSMMHNYGALLAEMGEHERAAELLEEALERRSDVLGDAHKDTCATMANLAVVLHKQGKLQDELKLRREHVAARRKLGATEKETLEAIGELCLLLVEVRCNHVLTTHTS